MPKKNTKFDFEKSLSELEQLVEKMEEGDLSLEESLKHFEHGIALTRACQQALAEAEQKVQILTEKRGKTELTPFTPDENKE